MQPIKYLTTLLFVFCAISLQAQEVKDTIQKSGRKGSVSIEVVPCPCDSNKMDSIVASCFDTLYHIVWQPSILDIADSIALANGVPPKLVYEIGLNESRWPKIYDTSYLIRNGDLQVMEATFNIMYKRLGLTGGKTRYNYLVIGIVYLKNNYNTYGSWKKARYAYGRGSWKAPNQWTSLEKKFMNKIDWNQYE